MNSRKIEEHLQLMQSLQRGDKINCPFCGIGNIEKKNDAVFVCDTCGTGIIGRVNIES